MIKCRRKEKPVSCVAECATQNGIISKSSEEQQTGDGCSTGDTPRDQSFYEFVPNVDEYGYNCDPREEEA